jgi:hypothetical protein
MAGPYLLDAAAAQFVTGAAIHHQTINKDSFYRSIRNQLSNKTI